MPFVKPMLTAVVAAIACAFVAWVAKTQTVTAVEFYSDGLKRYVISADPKEVATWDAGSAQMGWARTGGQFTAYKYPWLGREAVCSFIGMGGKEATARFLSANANECGLAEQDAHWAYDKVAFYVPVPRAGKCAVGTYPVWRSRFTDPKGEVNDRLTTDLTAYSRMTRQGFAPGGVVMCAPVSGGEEEDDTPPVTPDKYCHAYKIAPDPVGWEFFRQAKTAPDQLRLRMAHVWHQIFVMSDGSGTYVYADFHKRLRDNVLCTFENLLLKFALSP